MEENEENIILVPYLDISQWPNDLHLQFNQTQDEQMDAEYDAENPAPAKLATAIADHKAAVQAENTASSCCARTPRASSAPPPP